MITSFQLFESQGGQQPLALSTGDRLYLSDEIVDKYRDRFEDPNPPNPTYWAHKRLTNILGARTIHTKLKSSWQRDGMTYTMTVYFSDIKPARDFPSGKFNYYVNGNSGDSEMHGKNMKRATRTVNYDIICQIYPIFKLVPKGYDRLKAGELFLDLVREVLIKDPSAARLGVPRGIEDFDWATEAGEMGFFVKEDLDQAFASMSLFTLRKKLGDMIISLQDVPVTVTVPFGESQLRITRVYASEQSAYFCGQYVEQDPIFSHTWSIGVLEFEAALRLKEALWAQYSWKFEGEEMGFFTQEL